MTTTRVLDFDHLPVCAKAGVNVDETDCGVTDSGNGREEGAAECQTVLASRKPCLVLARRFNSQPR